MFEKTAPYVEKGSYGYVGYVPGRAAVRSGQSPERSQRKAKNVLLEYALRSGKPERSRMT